MHEIIIVTLKHAITWFKIFFTNNNSHKMSSDTGSVPDSKMHKVYISQLNVTRS